MTWEFTPELETRILDLLADGVSLVKICQMPDMPSRATVLRYQRDNPDFDSKCARAREYQGEHAAEMLDDINERVLNGVLEPQAANVVSANLKWKAMKLYSKKYGDSTQVRLADNEGNKLSVGSLLGAIDGRTASLPRTIEEAE